MPPNCSDRQNRAEGVELGRPWLLDSDALVTGYPEGQSVTRFLADDASFEYFLEVPLVQDIRHQVEAAGRSSEEALDVLLYYAENDAFPQ